MWNFSLLLFACSLALLIVSIMALWTWSPCHYVACCRTEALCCIKLELQHSETWCHAIYCGVAFLWNPCSMLLISMLLVVMFLCCSCHSLPRWCSCFRLMPSPVVVTCWLPFAALAVTISSEFNHIYIPLWTTDAVKMQLYRNADINEIFLICP